LILQSQIRFKWKSSKENVNAQLVFSRIDADFVVKAVVDYINQIKIKQIHFHKKNFFIANYFYSRFIR